MQFEKDSTRTKELGRKGGQALHPNGTKTEQKYRYKKCTIEWIKSKHAWRAKSDDGKILIYARSVAEIKRMIIKERGDHPTEYIAAKPEI
jgi:hypothetical protein